MGPLEVDPGDRQPISGSASRAAPNPFRESTTVRYSTRQQGRVRIVVHDMSGSRIRVLADGLLEPGFHSTTWDGTDNAGKTCSSGVYWVRMYFPGGAETKTVVLIR